MDGGLTPNDLLDTFEVLTDVDAPTDVMPLDDGRALLTAGRSLLAADLTTGALSVLADLGGTALGIDRLGDEVLVCVVGKGLLAYHLGTGEVRVLVDASRGPRDGAADLSAVAVFRGRVFVTTPSTRTSWDEWPRDLMTKQRVGALHEVAPGGELKELLTGLGWAYGLCADAEGLVYTESWNHRVMRYDVDSGRTTVIRDRLLGYPARVRTTASGTLMVAMFALRTELTEFVLREDAYRARMIAEVPMSDWVGPAYFPSKSVREPAQLGGIVKLGEIKPWAPARSYGLVAEVDAHGRVLRSFHSRAGGERHGVTAGCVVGDRLVVVCHGRGQVLTTRVEGEVRR
jgi:hypothetical protein